MIDEYQDTSDLQECFINNIANNNLYVVGDVKQSIYRFRNADCSIFLNRFNEYTKGNGGKRLDLPHNFRSRKEVLREINLFFQNLMTKESMNLDYLNGHVMQYKEGAYDTNIDPTMDYGIKICNYDKPENISQHEYEASLIASDISKRIKNGFKVLEKDKLVSGSYKHFAIICATKTEFETYKKVLQEYKIPVFAQADKQIRDNDLTLVLENIIKCLTMLNHNEIKNKEFKHAFLSLYRSFLSHRDDNKLVDIVKKENYEEFETYRILQRINQKIETHNLEFTIETIINEFDIFNKLSTIGNVQQNINLLNHFYQTAKQMDKMNYSLFDFKEYFEDLKKFEVEAEMKEYDDTSDSVKLLSIHASKGLQYKICYFPMIKHKINFQEYNKQLIVDLTYGVRITHTNSKSPKDFFHYLITETQHTAQVQETLRTLYVALTRVEELGIILIPKGKSNTKKYFNEICDINHFFEVAQHAFPTYSMEITKPSLMKEEANFNNISKITIKDQQEMDQTKIQINHAAKVKDDSINEELLLLGNKYHYYLELIDFKTKDTSFIKDDIDRKRIERFIHSSIFAHISNAEISHEYQFYDEINHVHGVIDLLVIYDDHIDIIDFKLSHVDDDAYEKQLSIYQRYIAQISNLPIHTYVTGIMSGKIKQIS